MGFVGIAVFTQSYLSSPQTHSSSSVKQASSARGDSRSVPYKHNTSKHSVQRDEEKLQRMCSSVGGIKCSSLLGAFSPKIQLHLHREIWHIIHPQQPQPHPGLLL